VVRSQGQKCGLKYVIYTFGKFIEKFPEKEANRLAAAPQRQHWRLEVAVRRYLAGRFPEGKRPLQRNVDLLIKYRYQALLK
jgi:hypothetical protein